MQVKSIGFWIDHQKGGSIPGQTVPAPRIRPNNSWGHISREMWNPILTSWRAAEDGHADGAHHMTERVYAQGRRYPRASLPNGMSVAWLGSDLQFFSRVQTIGIGGLFIATPNPAPVGTKLRLTFQVPGGSALPVAIVRNGPRPGDGCRVHENGAIRALFTRKLDGTIIALKQKPLGPGSRTPDPIRSVEKGRVGKQFG